MDAVEKGALRKAQPPEAWPSLPEYLTVLNTSRIRGVSATLGIVGGQLSQAMGRARLPAAAQRRPACRHNRS